MTDHAKNLFERKAKKQLVGELKLLRRKVADTDLLLAELIRSYEEAPVGLCYFDTNLRFLHINDWLAAINGMPVAEHLGRTIGEVLPNVAAGIESQLRHVIETGEPTVGGAVDAETPAHPGLTRTFEHSYFPIKSGDDTVVGVSCVVQEITECKRAEESLRKAYDELERRVEERTSMLNTVNTQLLGEIAEHERTEKALRAARDESQLANAAKSEFLANMSHELRTPLNAVIGFSEVMKQGILGPVGNPKYLEYAEDIHDAGNHLLDLINDILDLSKVEGGKNELQEEVIEIAGLLDSVRMLVSGRAEREGVALEFDVGRGLPALRADERKLKQILVNLLSNAIKFTDAGGRVTFRVWHRADSGMVFQVADTGIGIAADDIPIALAPFRLVEDALVRKYQGPGLGLPLAKSLVEMHGGSLDLQSELGVGTTATVRLPESRVILVDAIPQKRAS